MTMQIAFETVTCTVAGLYFNHLILKHSGTGHWQTISSLTRFARRNSGVEGSPHSTVGVDIVISVNEGVPFKPS